MVTIRLSDTEVDVAGIAGRLRHQQNREGNTTNYMDGVAEEEQIERDILGVKGELAFCKWARTYPGCLTCHNRRLTHDGVAFGQRIDVKTRSWEEGLLEVRTNKQFSNTQVYVLIVGSKDDPAVFRLVGWAYAGDVYQPENLRSYADGERFVMEQEDLRPMLELWERWGDD